MADDIPYVDFEVDKTNLSEGLLKVLEILRPNWNKDDIRLEDMQQGFINKMVLCKVDENKSDWLVARIFGADMGILLVQREREVRNSKLLSEVGIGPRVVGTFKNGLISAFVNGKTYFWFDLSAFRDRKFLRSIARTYAKLHSKAVLHLATDKYSLDVGRTLQDVMKKFSQDLPDIIVDEETTKWFCSQVPTNEERRAELEIILDNYLKLGADWCFSHNDSNPTNIIYDEEHDKVTLVDFEMCGVGKPFSDMSNFILSSACGMAPDPEGHFHSPEVVKEVIRTYLEEKNRLDKIERDVTNEEVERFCEMMEAAGISGQYFFHAIAPHVMNADGKRHIDPKSFLGLSIARLGYYRKNKDRMLEIFNKYKNTSSWSEAIP